MNGTNRFVPIRIRSGLEVRLGDVNPEVEKSLRGAFTYENPEHEKKRRMGLWLGNTPRLIRNYQESEDGELLILPRGGTEKVRRVLRRAGFDWHFNDERLELESIDVTEGTGAEPVVLREEQERIVSAILSRENCFIKAATASGKTECAIELVKRIRQPTIVIVWSSALMKQWVSRLALRLGWDPSDIGILGSGKARIGPITVAMQQSLYRWTGYEESFGAVILDEAHAAAARTVREVIGRFPARWRIGFSADDKRKDRLEVLTHDSFGEPILEVSKEEMIAKGSICPVRIEVTPTDFDVPDISSASPDIRGSLISNRWPEILNQIADDPDRNDTIVERAIEEASAGHSVLVFVNRVAHARALARLTVEAGQPCGVCVGGATNKREFEESVERLTSGAIRIVFGTSCVYQGLDVPRLGVGIVASPTARNKQLLEQQVGRLRRKYPGKTEGRLIYLWDHQLFPTHAGLIRRYYGDRYVQVMD